jgi:hypothetical protein
MAILCGRRNPLSGDVARTLCVSYVISEREKKVQKSFFFLLTLGYATFLVPFFYAKGYSPKFFTSVA